MLTNRQLKYLADMPKELAETPVKILPWSEQGLVTAENIVRELAAAVPELTFHLVGSVPLRIAGLRDLDLTCGCSAAQFPDYRARLRSLLGEPEKINVSSLVWHFVRDGYEVGIYVTDAELSDQLERQLRQLNILQQNPELCLAYETLKLSLDGQPYIRYQEQKKEFFNTLLTIPV